MARRYPAPKFTISKATLPALEKKRLETIKEIKDLESKLTLPHFEQDSREFNGAQNRIKAIYKEINELKKITQPKKGLVGSIFGSTEVMPDAQRKINALENEQSSLMSKANSEHGKKVISQASKAAYKEAKVAYLEKIEARIGLLERKKDSLDVLKSKAAKNSEEVRVIAGTVKRKLDKNDECPYCGDLINGIGHADHIYPVSKGGRSLKKNMVYVCASCNLKKKDLTLTMFIKKYDLDRDLIEERLIELGKEV